MKVGLYATRFPKTTETWAVNKFLGLLDAGVDVVVFSQNGKGDWERFPSLGAEHRARVVVNPPPLRGLLRAFTTSPREFARYAVHNWRAREQHQLGFRRAMTYRLLFFGQRLDILHLELDTAAPSTGDVKHYLKSLLLASGRSTLQYTARLDDRPEGVGSVFRNIDAYHVETAYTETNLRHLGLDQSIPIYMIPSSIDAQNRFTRQERREREPGDEFRVLTIGRLEVEKGLEFAVTAIAAARDAGVDVRYRIVGDGQHRPAVAMAVHRHGLGGRVEFCGSRPPDEIIEHYRWADVLLHASTDEGVPNVPLEAQATGLPVVISAAAGNPDTVADGITGFVVPVRSAPDLADALVRLATDTALAARMGDAARARMVEWGNQKRWIESYVELYRALDARRETHSS